MIIQLYIIKASLSTHFVKFIDYLTHNVYNEKTNIEGNENMSNFNVILQNLRKNKGLSQTELAKKIGVAPSTIGMYETGKREPNYETLEIIADFFNVDMNYLLGKEPEQTLDQKLEGIDFALWGVIQDLSDEAKEDILKYAEFAKMREQQKNNRD